MSTIELIGSIDGQLRYSAEDVAGLLSLNKEPLLVGTAFTGRPDTRIYAGERDVAKIRAELDLCLDKARKWAANMLRQEQSLAIHHPHKTWFVLEDCASSGKVLVGSVCPRLKPLNVELKPPPETEAMRERYFSILAAMFEKYLALARKSNLKLDEGLSNFAVDDEGNVYYLDDECYIWDNFVAFAVMLGVFIRAYDWLDEAFMTRLTQILVNLVDDIFHDSHCRIIISTQLQSLFMPNEQKERLLKALLSGLAQTASAAHPYKKPDKHKIDSGRYYAVLADIHANGAALDRVLAFYREQNITEGIVLGDIVGYGPDPDYCIERLQDADFDIIKGNHDYAVATANTERGFSATAKTVIAWTIDRLSVEQRNWLNNLPVYTQNSEWLAVHGAPIDPAFFYGYVYQMTAAENLDCLQQRGVALCLHGHSHTPGVYVRNRLLDCQFLTDDRLYVGGYAHALACPGSVGQPRNGRQETQCAVYDREKKEMVFIALSYCVDSVVKKMQYHGLPETLWQRLQTGR